jgi:hypothetical protein
VYEDDGTDPLYFRMKASAPAVTITIELIVEALQTIDKRLLNSFAEKYESDIPRMISATIQAYIKEEGKKGAGDKYALQISSNKERGYQRKVDEHVPDEIMKIARDLLLAKKELQKMKQKQSEEKKPAISKQKEVESMVKEALKHSDPSNMTTRVHMMQDDNEWVYYLRCKEKEKNVPMGIRKIIPIVETAVGKLLDEYGLPRFYSSSTFNPDAHFWKNLTTSISKDFNDKSSETVVSSKLSLDRGAPRQRKKV